MAYLLKASKAVLGAMGILHFGVAAWVGQNPVVSTRTNRSTPARFVWMQTKYNAQS